MHDVMEMSILLRNVT